MATYIEILQRPASPPTGKQQMAGTYSYDARFDAENTEYQRLLNISQRVTWDYGATIPLPMFGALYRLHFPLTSEVKAAASEPVRVPKKPDMQQLNQDNPR